MVSEICEAKTCSKNMDEKLAGIEKALVRVQVNLAEHMRRTKASEDRLEVMEDALKPLQIHVAVTGAVMKALLAALGAAGTLAGILKAVGVF